MPADRPNVLWICTDQQRYDTLGCYGNEFVDTPHLDRLAERGVRFDRCFGQSPVCTPSRASFLTGRYPRTTRCRQNGQSIPAGEELVTRRLADAGYTCGLSGKLHLSPCKPVETKGHPFAERRVDDGYAEFHWSQNNGPDWPTNEYLHWLRDRNVDFERHIYTDSASDTQRIDRSGEYPDTPVAGSEYVQISMPPEHHHTTWCTQKAVNFIEANAAVDRPWLFSMNTFDPHHAFDPPMEYLERYLDRLDDVPLPAYETGELDDKPIFQRLDHENAYNTPDTYPFVEMDAADHRLVRAAYWAMIDLIDDQVGRLLDTLERTGQREDTLVIFMSDHGEMLGDHGIYLKGPYFYDPAVRVPLILEWPDRIDGGRASDALVELTDLTPTLLDAAGVEHPDGIQGRSLWPLLSGETPLDDHREVVYSEYYNAMPWHTDPVPYGTMIRTDRHKLVRMHGLDSGELYDLERDPGETVNRWDDPAAEATKRDLLGRLSDAMARTVDPLPERLTDW
jgi:arylsulfatase A-like enzyme